MNRDQRAQQGLWSGLRRFVKLHEEGLTEIVADEVDFGAVASVIFEDNGEWCWAVTWSDGRTFGGAEPTRDAAEVECRQACLP